MHCCKVNNNNNNNNNNNIEMCAASKRVANLRVSLRLSPEGGGMGERGEIRTEQVRLGVSNR